MIRVSTCSVPGNNDYQEDRVIYKRLDPPLEHLLVMGVCDGHGGFACSEFVSQNSVPILYDEIKKNPKLNMKNNFQNGCEKICAAWDEQTLKGKTITNDKEKTAFFESIDLEDYEKNQLDSGSTLCLCMFDTSSRTMFIANLGDSRCVWKVGNIIAETIDHSVPTNREAPIVDGFNVKFVRGRCQGELAMVRCIGDNSPSLLGAVSRKFDIRSVKIKNNEYGHFIIGSDGFFDEFNTQSIFLNRRPSAEAFIKEIPLFQDNTSLICVEIHPVPKNDDDIALMFMSQLKMA